jgi:DNA modification methylase
MRTYQDGTDVSLDKICSFIPAWSEYVDYYAVNLGLKFQDGAVVPYWQQYIDTANNCGLKLLGWNVWDKQKAGSVAQATNMFTLTHEWIFVFGEKRKILERTVPNQLDKYAKRHGENFLTDGADRAIRKQDGSMSEKTASPVYTHHQLHSVIRCFPELGDVRKLHPAIYPIELPTQYFEAMTESDDLIADPFLGSGTSIIAAQKMEGDRTVYGFELSEAYCEVICQRFFNLTGIEPKLIGKLPD